MAFNFSARTSAIGALLLAAGCMSGQSTGTKSDLAGTTDGNGNVGDNGSGTGTGTSTGTGTAALQAVAVQNLTSDQAGKASNVNGSMVNAWGIVGFQGWFWIADNASGKVSIVDGAGQMATAGMGSIGVASDALDLGEGITGVAVSDSTAMQMDNPSTCGPASLIFASEHGQLIGVNTQINPTGGQVLVDRSDVMAAYFGVGVLDITASTTCAPMGNSGGTGQGSGMGNDQGTGSDNGQGTGSDNGQGTGGTGNLPSPGVVVLAADFHNARVDVFDESFKLMPSPMFTAPSMIPAGYAPFNVEVFNSVVYVAYAQIDKTTGDATAGPGLGFVVAFDACGNAQWTASGDQLNAPWGMALGDDTSVAPGELLVGNFGDGHVTAVNFKDGTIAGQLTDATKAPIAIDGLWGLTLGTGVLNAQAGALYFAAGPAEEAHGAFGAIAPAATTTTPPPSM